MQSRHASVENALHSVAENFQGDGRFFVTGRSEVPAATTPTGKLEFGERFALDRQAARPFVENRRSGNSA